VLLDRHAIEAVVVGVFIPSVVGCMLTWVLQPQWSLPLKSDFHGAVSAAGAAQLSANRPPSKAVLVNRFLVKR
jgi:hypothetical protein